MRLMVHLEKQRADPLVARLLSSILGKVKCQVAVDFQFELNRRIIRLGSGSSAGEPILLATSFDRIEAGPVVEVPVESHLDSRDAATHDRTNVPDQLETDSRSRAASLRTTVRLPV